LNSKKRVKYTKQQFDVGRTQVKYVLTDGRKFSSWFYGYVDQRVEYGRHQCKSALIMRTEPFAGEPRISNSLEVAQLAITYLTPDTITFQDDRENVRKTVVGRAIEATIGRTESYMKEISVAKLVDNV
jgi:hypothetical protein